MSYSWDSISGQPTQGLVGSTISSNVPYFCGSNIDNNAYAVQGVGFTPVLTSFAASTAFTDMEISNSYFLCGFNYADRENLTAYVEKRTTDNQMTNYFSTYRAAMNAISVKGTDVVSVGGTSSGNALIVKTTTNMFANPFTTPHYNSNTVARTLSDVCILSDGTIISVGISTMNRPIIFANNGLNSSIVGTTGTYYSVVVDSSNNIYTCGVIDSKGFINKYTYSSGTFTSGWSYTDSNSSLYTSITIVNGELYVSGGCGSNFENCKPYILKLDIEGNLIISYIGT